MPDTPARTANRPTFRARRRRAKTAEPASSRPSSTTSASVHPVSVDQLVLSRPFQGSSARLFKQKYLESNFQGFVDPRELQYLNSRTVDRV